MARVIINLAILFVVIGLVSAAAQCYVAYSSSTHDYDTAGSFVLSVALQNGTKPSAAVATGVNATWGLNFINATHIAQYRSSTSSVHSTVEAVLFDVTTMEAGVSFELAPYSGDPFESFEGTAVTATNDGSMYWVGGGSHGETDGHYHFPKEKISIYTYSEASNEAVVFDTFEIIANGTFFTLSGSDVPRISGREFFFPNRWIATYSPSGNITYNATVDGVLPIPNGAGNCRGFVLDQTTGETQFMCDYSMETENGVINSAIVLLAKTLNEDVTLETIYSILNVEFADFYNDGTQWYILETQGTQGPVESFIIYTLTNDMQHSAKYGPYRVPPVEGLVFSMSMGALSCSSS